MIENPHQSRQAGGCNRYHGSVLKQLHTPHFNLLITHHRAQSTTPLHAHDKDYLCLSLAGSYTENKHTLTPVKPGTVLYRQGNYEHSNRFLNHDSLCLNLELKDSESILSERHIPKQSQFERPVTLALSKLILDLNTGLPNDLLDLRCFEAVLSHFEHTSTADKPQWIGKLKDNLRDDPTRKLSIQVLSQNFGLHPNYLVRKFKEVNGITLSTYIEQLRVEASLPGLLQAEQKTGTLAIDAGFYDQSHYIRAFKKHMGLSPLQFRKTAGRCIKG